MSDSAVDVLSGPDPVTAFLMAHAQGRNIRVPTSGTTGRPRLIERTTASWTDSFSEVADLSAMRRSSRVWIPGPVHGTMNLFAACLTAFMGARRVSEVRQATHAHLTPSTLASLVAQAIPLAGLHLVVAGDRLSQQLRDQVRAAGAEVSHYYGAAELSFVGWGSHDGDLAAFPRVEVEVRDAIVWVRSPYLCDGYAGTPGQMRRDARGFATVGDRGRLDQGTLYVYGRADTVVTGGATVVLSEVEAELRDSARGRLMALGLPHDQLGEILVAVLDRVEDLLAVRAVSRSRLAPAARPRIWFHVADIPTTELGKPDRARTRGLLMDGSPRAVRLPAGTSVT
jgi:acyl-CoA synthetase (AMP-forming)/AMP-acid ligase II